MFPTLQGPALQAVGDVCFGSVMGPSSQRANECRIAMFLAGFPTSVPVHTVNRQCSSGGRASPSTSLAHARFGVWCCFQLYVALGCTVCVKQRLVLLLGPPLLVLVSAVPHLQRTCLVALKCCRPCCCPPFSTDSSLLPVDPHLWWLPAWSCNWYYALMVHLSPPRSYRSASHC